MTGQKIHKNQQHIADISRKVTDDATLSAEMIYDFLILMVVRVCTNLSLPTSASLPSTPALPPFFPYRDFASPLQFSSP